MNIRAISKRDREALAAVIDDVRRLDLGPVSGPGQIAKRLAKGMTDLFGPRCAVYRPEATANGWSLEFIEAPALTRSALAAYGRLLAGSSNPSNLYLFNPLRPKPDERNVIRDISPEQIDRAPVSRPVFVQAGLGHMSQTRMLVCDGPLLLAWVGLFRPPDNPVTQRERWMFRRLASAASDPLRRARGLSAAASSIVLEAALAAYSGEAYLLRADGRIEFANEVGAARMRRSAREVVEQITTALAVYPKRTELELHAIHGDGIPPMFLATRSSAPTSDLEGRLSVVQVEWRLTPRQVDVLRRLVVGDSNKEVAARLALALRTVELHVGALMRRAKVDSRLRLVTRFWNAS